MIKPFGLIETKVAKKSHVSMRTWLSKSLLFL